MKRLHQFAPPSAPAADPFVARGDAWQRVQRQRELELRHHIVSLTTSWTDLRALTCQQAADLLHLTPRTLRQWHTNYRPARSALGAGLPTPPPLGRPVLRSPRQDRQAVLDLLKELGLATGVPTLRACFPDLPRAELDDLLRRARHVCRRRYRQAQHVLCWTAPGAVWAMDFTEAPAPIDGIYPYLLAVRDLASGKLLLALPLVTASAQETIPALAPLFAGHGAPLVLKTDNGSPFCAGLTQEFLHDHRVTMLFSPPHWPRYNGAIEAGIGSLKIRAEQHAARHDRPGHWTWDDVAWAQAQANATARPRGPNRPTPDEAWAARPTITAEERLLFQASVAQHCTEVRAQDGWPSIGPLNVMDERAIDRQAIQRALVEHDYLVFRRRRLPLTFTKQKAAKIM